LILTKLIYLFITIISIMCKLTFDIQNINLNTLTTTPIINKKNEYQNKDIIGTINVANTEKIVVQTTDNEYYLNHDLNKRNSIYGTIFLDYRNNIEDKQLNIYGHNSSNDKGPFNILEQYLNKSFYNKNKYITLSTKENTFIYEIFSVAKTSTNEHMKINFNNNSDWLIHLNKLKTMSIYNTDIDINNNDKIIVLQTCVMNSNPKQYILIIGKLIKIV